MQDKILDLLVFAGCLCMLPAILHFAIKRSPLRLTLLGLRCNTVVALLLIAVSLIVATTAGPMAQSRFDGSIWPGILLIFGAGVAGATLIYGPMLIWLAVELHLAAVQAFQSGADATAYAKPVARWLHRTWLLHSALCRSRGVNPRQVLEHFESAATGR